MQNQPSTAVAPKAEKFVEFVPFGAADKIKLSIAIVQNIVAVKTRSGKTCSEQDAMKFIMLCQAQRLNPFAGDAFLVGYDGANGATFSLITAHQAFLKRAETSPDFDGMTSGIILLVEEGKTVDREGDFHLPGEKVVGGWAKVFHKKRTHPTYRAIRMERFNNGFAQWKVDGAGMIVKCAEADALRSTFPTMLGGLYLREEDNELSAVPKQTSTGSFIDAGDAVRASDAKSPQQSAAVVDAPPQSSAPAETLALDPLFNADKPYDSLMAMMERDGVTDGQVLKHAQRLQLARSTHKEVGNMTEANMVKLAESWATVLPEIKKIEA